MADSEGKNEPDSQTKNAAIGCGILIVVVVVIALVTTVCNAIRGPGPPPTPEERLQQIAERCLSPWDGSFEPLSDYLKRNVLLFPDTWEHDRTSIYPEGDYYRVFTDFRASGLLGQRRHRAYADMDKDCNLVEVVDVQER